MIEANRFKLGLFIVAAGIAGLAILFALGMADLFQKKIMITTIFTESVQGLEMGAPLKLKGVSIGSVKKMTVNLSKKHVRVDMEANLSAIAPDKWEHFDPELFREHMESEIIRGLRCRLELAGITGLKYVELNYFPQSSPIVAIRPPEDVIYIPSTPSMLSGISSSLTETMARLASINYEEISTQLVETLRSINRLFDDPKIQSMIEKMEKISANLETTTTNINQTLNENELQEIITLLKGNLDSINKLAETIRKELEEAKIPQTTESARGAFDNATERLKEISALKRRINATLSKLDEAIDSLTELVQGLDDDPARLIKGKREPVNTEKSKHE